MEELDRVPSPVFLIWHCFVKVEEEKEKNFLDSNRAVGESPRAARSFDPDALLNS